MNGGKTVKRSNISISVIVPVYNVEKYLDDCLTSIAAQSVPFDEVILVNDGSTDGSGKICEGYCRNNRNFTLIRQQNLGQSEARNAGLKIAGGDYIIFIDSDDYVQTRMAEQLKRELGAKNCDVLYFNASVIDELNIGEPISVFIRDAKYYDKDMTGMEYLMESFPSNYLVSPCLAAYRREFLKEHGIWFPKGIYYEDHPFCLKVILAAQRVRNMSDAFYIRRRRQDSTTTGKMTDKKYSDLITVNRLIWEELRAQKIEHTFLIRIISKYLLDIRNVLCSLKLSGKTALEREELLEYFLIYWLQLYLVTARTLGDSVILLFILQEVKKREKTSFSLSSYFEEGEYERYVDILRREIEKSITDMLKEIPLGDPDQIIGIFGIGHHTGKMIDLYRRYVGEIRCSLYYIVTDAQQKQEEFLGRALVGCDDILPDTDMIVISSFIYQKDIYGELVKRNIPDDKIKRFYDDKEICDLICAWDVLSENEQPGVA